jgi:acyl dehydratase
LPTAHQTVERERDRRAAVPAGVELLAGLVVDPDVVHVDGRAGRGLGTVTDDQVGDDQFGGRIAQGGLDLGLGQVAHGSSQSDARATEARRSRAGRDRLRSSDW